MKIIFVLLIFASSIFAQTEKNVCSTKDRIKVIEYFRQIEQQNDFINECNLKSTENLPDNLKTLPKIISHLSPSAIGLVKPFYPNFARENKFFGTVFVEVIFDEKGFVISAQAVKGNKIFYNSAEKAACASIFTPVRYCKKALKQQRIIVYNFVL